MNLAATPWTAIALAQVEDAGLNASAPPEQRLLDGWLLRLSPGKAKRARCVNAICAGRLPLAEKLARCAEAYRAVGLPLIVRITPFSEPADLDASLDAMGWRRFDDTRVMVHGDLHQLGKAEPETLPLRAVSPAGFAQAVGTLRGSPPAQCEAHARRLLAAPVAHRAFIIRRDDHTVACGQYAVEADLVGLYDVFTAPSARRGGIATALCRALLQRARDDGARRAYLQVEGDNQAARSVYHRLGFADAYAYHYRTTDPEAA